MASRNSFGDAAIDADNVNEKQVVMAKNSKWYEDTGVSYATNRY
jgi:hypothetical protein